MIRCHKKYFADRKAAKKFIREFNLKKVDDCKLTSVYFCDYCNGYHCTSQPKEQRNISARKLNKSKP